MAKLRKLATPDTLLVAIASAIIVFSLRGESESRQSIQVTAADGQVRDYSLPVDHPTLQKLKSRFAKPKPQLPPAALAIARWNYELASLYSQELYTPETRVEESQDEFVVPVAYHDAGQHDSGDQRDRVNEKRETADATDPASRLYWLAAREEARQVIEVVEQKIAEKKALSPPRVVFGAVFQDQHIPLACTFACLGGLLLACGYAQWRQQSPVIQLRPGKGGSEVRLSLETESGVQHDLDVPDDWVQVRQPWQVQMRRASVIAIAAWALMTIVL